MSSENIYINTQSSIKIDDIYFDPFKIKDETHDARIVFITHSHYDHFDMESIRKIENDDTLFVIPNDMDILEGLSSRNIFLVEPDREYEVDGVRFKTVFAYNNDKSFHKKEFGWVGYLVYLDSSYYVMGDTDLTDESKDVKCDYLFVPIGGTYTMDYKEAANLTNIIKPKTVIPIHYGSIVGDKSDGEKFKNLIDDGIDVEILL